MKRLKIAIIIFIIIAGLSLYIVLNKGKVGSYSLVQRSESESSEESSEEVIPKISIYIDKEYLSSVKSDKDTATVTVYMDDEEVTSGATYSSSDETIAKISDGVITPVKDGKVKITAEYDGLEDSEEINVVTPIKSMSLSSSNSIIRVGKELELGLTTTPSNAYRDVVKYSSSDEEIATVTKSGIVKGIAPGKVTITAYDTYTEEEAEINITIKK